MYLRSTVSIGGSFCKIRVCLVMRTYTSPSTDTRHIMGELSVLQSQVLTCSQTNGAEALGKMLRLSKYLLVRTALRRGDSLNKKLRQGLGQA
jgi:hypothetical protein